MDKRQVNEVAAAEAATAVVRKLNAALELAAQAGLHVEISVHERRFMNPEDTGHHLRATQIGIRVCQRQVIAYESPGGDDFSGTRRKDAK